MQYQIDETYLEKVKDWYKLKIYSLELLDKSSGKKVSFNEKGDPLDNYKFLDDVSQKRDSLNFSISVLEKMSQLKLENNNFHLYSKLAEALYNEDYELAEKIKIDIQN